MIRRGITKAYLRCVRWVAILLIFVSFISGASKPARAESEPDADLAVTLYMVENPLLVGLQTEVVAEIYNLDKQESSDFTLTVELPDELVFLAVDSDPSCTAVGTIVTCSGSPVLPETNAVVRIGVRAAVEAEHGLRRLVQALVTGNLPDPILLNNQATLPVMLSHSKVMYQTDFEDGKVFGEGWSDVFVRYSPTGEGLLGHFTNQRIYLNLINLPPHSAVQIQFDLYIIWSWDGNTVENTDPLFAETIVGPDLFILDVNGYPLRQMTFTNWAHLRQSYPAEYDEGDFPAFSGARAVNSLGYIWNWMPMDSTYHIDEITAHSASFIEIGFTALGLQHISDETWAIDNVVVIVWTEAPEPSRISLPVVWGE